MGPVSSLLRKHFRREKGDTNTANQESDQKRKHNEMREEFEYTVY